MQDLGVLAVLNHSQQTLLSSFADEGVGVGALLEHDLAQLVQLGLHAALQEAEHVDQREKGDLGQGGPERLSYLDDLAHQARDHAALLHQDARVVLAQSSDYAASFKSYRPVLTGEHKIERFLQLLLRIAKWL